ncbi:RES family NAD+ phosphorylase [Paraburkholderia bonniea]|uniref:RES family NAD+ phosphorylase n=1 Tax=Paraburkholderia bonniea TaxID=2152891 RepID=UPI001292591E|nr:RES family NAD+ phosphorylase [Paraburkholderia bonniea]WJF91912.1 RES family NAD+ phosphorylase [Paraburkholderia bonniea]WJF95231.1 RES family NAD+ phosphorylase [Paraburkholderia bonniea]
MKVFRLAKEKPGRYRADDLSGNGAALTGGRWNPRGLPVLYTCCSASTAVLEARVHAAGLLPVANFYLVALEVPDRAVTAAYVPALPDDWNVLDHDPASTVALARQWLEEGKRLVMRVPSVVCPTDDNLILNPVHAGMTQVKVLYKQRFELDRRLFK